LEVFLRKKSKMPNELMSLRHGCRWFQPSGFILGSVAVLQQEHSATVRYRTQLDAARPLPARSQWRPERYQPRDYAIGQLVKHRIYPFRGVIFDVDPVFANTEEWLASIPIRICPAGRGNLRLPGNSAIFCVFIEGPWSVAHWRH
jgi:hypothetical protein